MERYNGIRYNDADKILSLSLNVAVNNPIEQFMQTIK